MTTTMSDDLGPPELTTTLETDGERPVLRVAGEVDLVTAPQLERALAEGLGHGRGLQVDLRQVAFMDSNGLRALLDARRRSEASGAVITLALAEAGPVTRLLELAGVVGLFGREDVGPDPA